MLPAPRLTHARVCATGGVDPLLQRAKEAHATFFHELGDPLSYMTVFQQWHRASRAGKAAGDQWCKDKFVMGRAMRLASNIHRQLLQVATSAAQAERARVARLGTSGKRQRKDGGGDEHDSKAVTENVSKYPAGDVDGYSKGHLKAIRKAVSVCCVCVLPPQVLIRVLLHWHCATNADLCWLLYELCHKMWHDRCIQDDGRHIPVRGCCWVLVLLVALVLTVKVPCRLVHMHPTSALVWGEPPDTVVFHELVQSSRGYMRHVTGVQQRWIKPQLERARGVDAHRLTGRTAPVKQAEPAAAASSGGGAGGGAGAGAAVTSEESAASAAEAAAKKREAVIAAARARFLARKKT